MKKEAMEEPAGKEEKEEKAEQAGRKENTEKKDYVEIPPRTIALLIGKQDLK